MRGCLKKKQSCSATCFFEISFLLLVRYGVKPTFLEKGFVYCRDSQVLYLALLSRVVEAPPVFACREAEKLPRAQLCLRVNFKESVPTRT